MGILTDIPEFPLKILNKPPWDWYGRKATPRAMVFPFLTYGWSGYIDNVMLYRGEYFIKPGCPSKIQNRVVTRREATLLFQTHYHVSKIPAVQTDFFRGTSYDVPMDYVMISDTQHSRIFPAVYLIILYNVCEGHPTYWIHPEMPSVMVSHTKGAIAVLREPSMDSPKKEKLDELRRRGVLRARRNWELRLPRTRGYKGRPELLRNNPDFLFGRSQFYSIKDGK